MKLGEGKDTLQGLQKETIIGDISGVYGVGNLPGDFLYSLSLRSILWGGNPDKEIILPNASDNIQNNLAQIKENLLHILSIPQENLRIGDFSKLSENEKREPYMRTPYYFDNEFLLEQKESFELVRDFGDKVYLANFIKNSGLENILPGNTYNYLLGDNFNKVKKEALNRFNNKQNFIVKAGEGASGENMILVFFEKDKIYVAHHKTNGKKKIKNIKDFKEELDIAIPENQKYKKGNFNINGYDENALSEQYFLIQDLVDTEKFEEKSINFFISEKGIYPITYGSNIAKGGVHQGNIEEIIPKKLFAEFNLLLEKIKNQGYKGPIGFDFFYNRETIEVKIIEANTRYTAPITPTMLVHKLEKQRKIPKNWTWRLLQKFYTKTDLIKINELKQFDLVNSLKKEENIKNPKFLVYGPKNGNYQSIIIIGPNQQEINHLYDQINLVLKNKK